MVMKTIKNMKKLFLLVLLAGLISPLTTKATHLMGVDITYVCLGGNTYEFTLTAYRDCKGVTPGTIMTLNFNSTSCGQSFSRQLPKFGPEIEVSEVCPTSLSQTTCANRTNPLPGTEAWIYKDTITLPAQCNDWVIDWNSCCRNNAITNLQTPGSQSMFIKVTLDNTNGLCNNSPQYASIPTPYICTNQAFQYNHGAWDIDGDSLYYRLAQPLTTPGPPGTPINYTAGHSIPSPVRTSSGFQFDNRTGTMCFTPNVAQMCVVSVIIEEYRNRVKIAEHVREMQIVVAAGCTNQSPKIVGSSTCTGGYGFVNVQGGASVIVVDSNSIMMCPGDSVCFDIMGTDPDGDDITVSSNVATAIPGATFTTNCVCPNTVSTFCWKPTVADSGFHVFTVNMEDDACPIKGSQYYTFDILLWLETNAGGDKKYCTGGKPTQLHAVGGTSFTWSVISGDPINVGTNFSCNPCQTPSATPSVSTTYLVTSDLQGSCKNTDTVTINIAPPFTMTIAPDDTICLNETTTVTVTPDASYPPYTFQWGPSNSLAYDTAQTSAAFPKATTTYTATVTSSAGCIMEDSMNVNVWGIAPIVNAYADPDTICEGDSVNLEGFIVTQRDNFDVTIDTSQWFNVTGVRSGNCGYINGPAALWFNTTWPIKREAETKDLNVANGGVVRFWIKFGSGLAPCDDPENGDDVRLEYSTNAGGTWTLMTLIDEDLNTSWTLFEVPIPGAAMTASTRFRWQQQGFSSTNQDNWAMDEVMIGSKTGFFNYSWTPTTGLTSTNTLDADAQVNATTTYTLHAESILNPDCVGQTDVTIWAGPDFTLTTNADTTICFGDDAQIYVNADLPGPYTYAWTPAHNLGNDSIYDPLSMARSTTNYDVTVSNGLCVKTASTEVAVTGTPVMATTDDDSVCIGETVNLEAFVGSSMNDDFNGGPNMTYWSSLTGGFNSANCGFNSAPDAMYFNGATTREIITQDMVVFGGCIVDFWLKFGTGGAPCDNADAGEDVMLEYSLDGGATWVWINTYDESVYTTWTNIQEPIPAAAAGPNTRFRIHQPTHFWGTQDNWSIDDVVINCGNNSGKSYSWTPTTGLNNPNIKNPTATITNTIDYVVTVLDSANLACVAMDTITIYAAPNFTLTTTPDTGICWGDDVMLSTVPDVAGTYYYDWTPNTALDDPKIANPTSSTVQNTTYTVQVTNGFCEHFDQVTVSIGGAQVTAVSSTDSICPGDSVNLDVISGSMKENFDPINNALWTNISGGAVSTDCGAASGSAMYFNGFGQRSISTVDLAVLTGGTVQFQLKIGNGLAPCEDADFGENVVLEYSINGGGTWINMATYNEALFPIFTLVFEPIPAGAQTPGTRFRVRQLSNSGVGNDNWAIDDFEIVSGAGGSYVYAWSPAGTLTDPNIKDPQAFPIVNELYTVEVTDTFGCVASDSVLINVGLKPVITMSPDTTICWGETVTISGIGVGGIIYEWTPSAGLSSTSVPAPQATPNTTTTYAVNVTNVFGCENSDSMTVTVQPQPNLSITPNSNICVGDNMQLNATGGLTYSWSPGSTLSDSTIADPIATPNVTTTYTVTVTDAANCEFTMDVTVTILQPIDVTVGADQEMCAGEAVLLTAAGAITYTWSPATGLSNPNIANPIASPNVTTTYMVIGSDGQCEPDTEYVTVTVNQPPLVDLGPNQVILKGETVTLNTTATGTYNWTPATGLDNTTGQSVEATPEVTTTYVLTVTDTNNCITIDSVTIFVQVEPCTDVFLPNAFTPNELSNSIFYVRGPSDIHITTFAIFNRWGDKVFEAVNFAADDPTFGWDGTYKGRKLSPAVFAYYVEGFCSTTGQDVFYKKGNITILK
jgi:hypothetical protein